MSKLIERLEKVDAASTPPLGFGANRTQNKPASMLLVALADAASTEALTKIQADFCVLSTPVSRRGGGQGCQRCPGRRHVGPVAHRHFPRVPGRHQGAGRRLLCLLRDGHTG